MPGDSSPIRRRTVLRTTGSVLALSAGASATASGDEPEPNGDGDGLLDRRCPDATIEPSMDDCGGASWGGCADDHPETVALRQEVAESLAETYPDVGALIEAGFKPYFDNLTDRNEGWSHWLSPEHIENDRALDPDRPESVLVDNRSWRSIGVMFIAVRGGEPVERPPTVYELDEDDERAGEGHANGDHGGAGGEHEGTGGEHEHADGDERRCAPWHYHAGVPGRFAWWYYRKVYESDAGFELGLPCRTPCMLHVWTVEHPESVYAHGGPPPEYREQPPAAEAGFETSAEPGEDELGWDVLPDDLVPDVLPEDLVPDVLPEDLP